MADQPRPIIANIDRLNRFLDQAGCSALILRSGKNFTYLAGFSYPGTLGTVSYTHLTLTTNREV